MRLKTSSRPQCVKTTCLCCLSRRIAVCSGGNGLYNTLRPRQNGRHFADDICKCFFLNENVWISIKISLKFVPKGATSNGSWCMGIKGEMSGTVCVTFTWDMYIYIWVVYSLCFFCCLFITVTWWYVWCIEWVSGNQEEVQACLVNLWLFIISCYSSYKTTLGLLCSWFENNPHFHKYSMDFHV